jgi:hypothetical protein
MIESPTLHDFRAAVAARVLCPLRLHAVFATMRPLRAHHLREIISALAIAGALLNAWVFTVHTTAMARAKTVTIAGMTVVICQADQDAGSSNKPSIPGKNCPICSGLAAFHIAVLTSIMLLAVTQPRAVNSFGAFAALFLDHRPLRIFNRGPPLAA